MADAAIVAENLVKCFGEVRAVDGVSLQVPRGRVLGLLGPNGAGKTTTVRMLTTLLRPDSGTVRVLDCDVARDAQRIRGLIGLAGQYAAVDENLTGAENLRLVGRLTHLPSAVTERRIADLLEGFALEDAGDRVVRTYSGGMRRRLDLAAALVHEPPVLFLDEPTTGLDPQGRTDLWHVIQTLVDGGTTVLLTTQYLEEADVLADNIIVIDHGKVIAEGTATQLKHQLGATVIEVGFKEPPDARAALGSLGVLGTASVDNRLVRVSVSDGATAMLEAVRLLDAASLKPATLALHEPTLDDVFLSLTGHAAEEESPDGEQPDSKRRGR
ncbi:MAG TPA: ATP-binding cassette domain-containing protein [Acidimicrobiia bacterium]|jgi:ABC-2 type transport system ATP-binding protein